MKKTVAILSIPTILILWYIMMIVYEDMPHYTPIMSNITAVRVAPYEFSSEDLSFSEFLITDPQDIAELVDIFNVKSELFHGCSCNVQGIEITFVSKGLTPYKYVLGINTDRILHYSNANLDASEIDTNKIFEFLRKYGIDKDAIYESIF